MSFSTDKFKLREDWQLCAVEDEEEQEEFFARVGVRNFNANCSSADDYLSRLFVKLQE